MTYLVATDGSGPSDRAVERAVELAEATGADVTAISLVVPEVRADPSVESVESLADAERTLIIEDVADAETRSERALDDATRIAVGTGVAVTTDLLYGSDPATAIVEYVDEVDAESIYVGHRGIGTRREQYLGSTAHDVIRMATVPVTVVR